MSVPVEENPEVIHPITDSETEGNVDPLGFVINGTYGWLVLFVSIGLVIVWRKIAGPHYQRWQETRSANRDSCHKDEEASLHRQRAIEASRLRLQVQMDAAADRHKEKLQEKEEAKRQARLLVYENMKKGRSSSSNDSPQEQTNSVDPSQKKPKEDRLRGNYFPLMSSEPNSCFRPSRRGGGSAGG